MGMLAINVFFICSTWRSAEHWSIVDADNVNGSIVLKQVVNRRRLRIHSSKIEHKESWIMIELCNKKYDK